MSAAEDFTPPVSRVVETPGGDSAECEFEALFLQHYARVLGVLLRLTGNRAQAEELANEVFWRLSQKSSSWLVMNSVSAWLYRTATNVGIDALRAAAHRNRYESAASQESHRSEFSDEDPLKELVREEGRRAVRTVLGAMKTSQAQILILRASGSSYKELAEALGVPVSSVGTLLNRAEAEFRKRYLKQVGGRNK